MAGPELEREQNFNPTTHLNFVNQLKMNLEKFASPKNIMKKIFSFGGAKDATAQEEKDKDRKAIGLNVIIMGADCVGKSVFLNKDKLDQFQVMEPTLGVTFWSKKQVVGEVQIQLKIWDTNGQQQYRETIPPYITNDSLPKICLIFYDVTDRKSFEEVSVFYRMWTDKLNNSPERASVIIVANKIDCHYCGDGCVTVEEGFDLARKFQAVFLLSSSLFDVSHVFDKLLEFKLSQLGIKYPPALQSQKKLPQNSPNSNQNSPLKLTPSQKSQLLKLLLSLQQLKTKLLSCKFNNISNKYLKMTQLKHLWEERVSTLQTTQFCIKKLKSEAGTTGGTTGANGGGIMGVGVGVGNDEDDLRNVEMLEVLKQGEIVQLRRVQKIIVGLLQNGEEIFGQLGELKEIKKLYQKYVELSNSAAGVLFNSEMKEQECKMNTVKTFTQIFIAYIDHLDSCTQFLHRKSQKSLAELLTESNQQQQLKNLITTFIASKYQPQNQPQHSTHSQNHNHTNTPNPHSHGHKLPKINKQQANMALLNMVKKDQKFVEENLGCFNLYLGKVREVMYEVLVRGDEDRLQIQKQIYQHNKKIIEKQWMALKGDSKK